ncbi:MAG: nucleoside hydrolase [Bryobacteraceae bacterium]
MLRFLTGLLLVWAAMAAGRDTIIFDTDSGLFGDDGASLVMLMRSPQRVHIAGITVVAGNVWPGQGSEYMFHILDLLKLPQPPLYAGAQTPLIHTAAMAREYARRWGPLEFAGAFDADPAVIKPAPGAKLTGRTPLPENAVHFIISTIERQPGEVTFLELGPMTNLALALRMRPDIETKIKRLVFMGGNVHVPGNASSAAEFNFWFDPEAAQIVLRSRIRQKVMFALDICNTAPIRKAQFDRIANAHTPIADLYREDLGNRYPGFLQHPSATAYMWDALATAWLLDPGFVTKSEVGYLDVLTAWGKFYGSTVALDRRVAPNATPVTQMLALDFNRVFALYQDLLTRKQ